MVARSSLGSSPGVPPASLHEFHLPHFEYIFHLRQRSRLEYIFDATIRHRSRASV